MRLSWNEIRARAAEFTREWADAAYEKGETGRMRVLIRCSNNNPRRPQHRHRKELPHHTSRSMIVSH